MDASVASPVHTTKGRALKKLHYSTTKHRYLWYVCKYKQVCQWGKGATKKQCSSVHPQFFPPKKGEKNRKEPNRPEYQQ